MDFYTNIPRELEDGGSERRKKIYSPTQSNVSQTERHPQTWDRNKKKRKKKENALKSLTNSIRSLNVDTTDMKLQHALALMSSTCRATLPTRNNSRIWFRQNGKWPLELQLLIIFVINMENQENLNKKKKDFFCSYYFI